MPERGVPMVFGLAEPLVVDVGGLRVMDGAFPPATDLPPHYHERPSVFVVLDGSFTERFGGARGRACDCSAAAVMAKPAGERHSNRFERAGARVVAVEPGPARAELFASLIPEAVHHFRDGRLEALARELAAEARAPDAAAALAVEGLALELLALVARRVRPAKSLGDDGRGRPPRWLREARDLVHAHFAEPLSARDVAAAVGVHPVHLARVFRAHHGVPLGAYVRRLRLRWAAARLRASEDPIAAIAVRAGFVDQSHFTRAFKRYAGRTPSVFRDS